MCDKISQRVSVSRSQHSSSCVRVCCSVSNQVSNSTEFYADLEIPCSPRTTSPSSVAALYWPKDCSIQSGYCQTSRKQPVCLADCDEAGDDCSGILAAGAPACKDLQGNVADLHVGLASIGAVTKRGFAIRLAVLVVAGLLSQNRERIQVYERWEHREESRPEGWGQRKECKAPTSLHASTVCRYKILHQHHTGCLPAELPRT